MRQDDGEGDVDQRDGEGADNGLVEREDSGQQEEKCFAIYEHPGGLRSEKGDQPWKESYKCDGIGESSSIGGEKMVGHQGESSIGGEKMMMGRENVRLKLALVECRLLLHDQVIKRNNYYYDKDA